MMRQTYRQEEAEEILKRAITRTAAGGPSGEVTQEQLESMAAELGVNAAALAAAAEELEAERSLQSDRQEFITKRRAGFLPHLTSYVGVIGFLAIVNLLTSPGYLWAVWPALGWGLGLFFHAVSDLPTRGPTFEAAFARWRDERQRREEQKRRRKKKDESKPKDENK